MATSSSTAVLVAGGAGYIGAHTAKALAEAGYTPVVFDDLSAGYREAVRWGPLVEGDVRDTDALARAISVHQIKAVIHFASLIEVGRSVARPDLFYNQNVGGTLSVLAAMKATGVKRLVFSSTAAVYGHADSMLVEDSPKDPVSPYGETKLACERMIDWHCRAFGMSAVALRYFNAAGADASGLIGEAHDPETHLIPLTIKAALGLAKPLTVFGDDFPTPDGACLRDYVHVNDLASAHVLALDAKVPDGGFEAANLGAGKGASVFEVIKTVEKILGIPVPFSVGPRRAGDPAMLLADAAKAKSLLGWRPRESSLEQIVESAANWHKNQVYGRAKPPLTPVN